MGRRLLLVVATAMEAYGTDHNGYAGMTLDEIQKYDWGVADITIVRASRDTYCVESGSGADEMHKNGPPSRSRAVPAPRADGTPG